MGLHKDEKLNHLLALLPEGVAAPSHWLSGQGYSRQLLRKYVQSNWLKPLGRGVYARPQVEVRWEGVVLGMQRLAGLSFHVGGITALNRQGYAHYLPLGGEKEIHLWGQGKVPAWVRTVPLPEKLQFHSSRLFDPQAAGTGLVDKSGGVRDWTIQMSAPERAIMEVLYEVQDYEASFIHALELFEGLTSLRPAVVNTLLQHCRNLKVKRLFLFMAGRVAYPWCEKIDNTKIELGSGKRVIVKGGKLDKHYLITVPERLDV